MTATILILAGDGIGPEVMAEAVLTLDWLRDHAGLDIAIEHDLVGGAAIDAHGVPLSDATLARARAADAILLGAVGGPKWDKVDFKIRPEAGLLALRKELDLFANLRPAQVFPALIDASTLKPEIVRGFDLIIVRELTGGVYFGEPRGITEIAPGIKRGVNTQVYTTPEIERVARVAFELARGRKGRLLSAEKANVMESGKLWREVVQALHDRDYADVALEHMYADALAMQLVRQPTRYDVVVTDNLFGDILSDQAAMLTGSLGMLPSASLGAPRADGSRPALYEPVHGSAPDIAGRGVANPLAMILSTAMMLRWSLGRADLADRLEKAVERVLDDGARTADLGGALTTSAMGAAVRAALAA